MSTGAWTYDRAERYLRSLELFGMRFGLDRMHRLMTALDLPQHRFDSIHVVGSNGKSSTARMIAAILERHGRRTGAYLSPHLVSFTERVQVRGRDTAEADFARSVQRAARAAELVNRTSGDEDQVTQFEALTAAAFVELAAHDVDVAVVEAGMGGRYDATNVIPSRVQVLTNVGLEHTRWLGPTVADIAREKLAVVREQATLVVGPLDADAAAQARAQAAARGARLVSALEPAPTHMAARGSFQRQNFALARTAAQAFMGECDDEAVAAAAGAVTVPGRAEIVALEPLTIHDGAHNPSGMRALVRSLPELAHGVAPVAVISILDDKDAAEMLRLLLPECAGVVFTASSNQRALPPATLRSLAGQLGFAQSPAAEIVGDPAGAHARARELAGPDGAVLATGSIYLVGDLAREPRAARAIGS